MNAGKCTGTTIIRIFLPGTVVQVSVLGGNAHGKAGPACNDIASPDSNYPWAGLCMGISQKKMSIGQVHFINLPPERGGGVVVSVVVVTALVVVVLVVVIVVVVVMTPALHVPLAVADEPFRNCPLLQVGWALHWYALVALKHAPVRYCDGAQVMLLQVGQVPLVVVDEPFRYSPLLQVGWALHW